MSALRLRRVGVRQVEVRGGDFWHLDWSGFDLVYLFQRPETMPRAWAKALKDLNAGSWLVSLEFEVPAVTPHAVLACPDGRTLWVYRVP
jgi:hypothetical protein